jgi:hypothetical protein
LLQEINVDVVAQQSRHCYFTNVLQLLTRESQVFVTRFVVESVAEPPIPELFGDDALKNKIIFQNFIFKI